METEFGVYMSLIWLKINTPKTWDMDLRYLKSDANGLNSDTLMKLLCAARNHLDLDLIKDVTSFPFFL